MELLRAQVVNLNYFSPDTSGALQPAAFNLSEEAAAICFSCLPLEASRNTVTGASAIVE